MIPMGPIEFTPAEVAVLLGMLVLLGVGAALPATVALAVVGHRRATRYPGWNALWYWLWATIGTVGLMGALLDAGLGWVGVPVSWLPGLGAAWVLRPRRPGSELGWTDTTPRQGER
ncbi:hypothetical protein [Kribbella sp. CA-247076]|uniref:hypothetical protein n=1 Tax=Kribbella sp. CA-247076 TaxID=3239941 RepID=UPI003D92BBED